MSEPSDWIKIKPRFNERGNFAGYDQVEGACYDVFEKEYEFISRSAYEQLKREYDLLNEQYNACCIECHNESEENFYIRKERDEIKTKYDALKGDRDKFLSTDDCYYWTPEAQAEAVEWKARYEATSADRDLLDNANIRLNEQLKAYREALEFSIKGLEMWHKYQSPANVTEVIERAREVLVKFGKGGG